MKKMPPEIRKVRAALLKFELLPMEVMESLHPHYVQKILSLTLQGYDARLYLGIPNARGIPPAGQDAQIYMAMDYWSKRKLLKISEKSIASDVAEDWERSDTAIRAAASKYKRAVFRLANKMRSAELPDPWKGIAAFMDVERGVWNMTALKKRVKKLARISS